MFLNNKQSLILSFIVFLCFFIAGIFGFLDNFMVVAIIVLGFIAVVLNLILILINHKKNPE